MRRLSRAVATTAVTLALPLVAIACNKEQDKTTAAPETKPADSPAAEPTQPSAGAPATPEAAKPTQPPAAGATPPAQPPGQPPMAAQPGKKPESVQDKHVKTADNIVAAATKFGETLAATKGDCKKATGVLKTGSAPLKTMMAETDKLQNDLKGDQAAMMWFQQTYGPKMMTALQKVGTVMQTCSSDKEFAAAFESLGLGGPPRRPPPPSPGLGGHGAAPPGAAPAPPAQAAPQQQSK